ncbi:hypothetical protein BANRA_05695 [Klebsiella pneumoniae]|nr:hypothetical protein BANRA_05695 [Klebsiella pneumoniae]
MPESLPAAFSRLAELKPGPAETTLIIDPVVPRSMPV